ncbi:MAG TPA: hypothetical protein DCE56_38900 [Cyanobacteria bacterium UBA8553]|nr:hypothetical protein [Cyanobacteria bacterium UBA8553]HAJ57990.1 hypothetical protein [Cyanobacteria bacterium UBA8543]
MKFSELTAVILLSAMKLADSGGTLSSFSSIDLNIGLPQIVCSVLLATGISATILYLLPLTLVATQLFQGFWASLEQEY